MKSTIGRRLDARYRRRARVAAWKTERRAVPDPLRRRRGKVPRQRVHPTGVRHALATEIRPRLVRVTQPKSCPRQASPSFVEFIALQADLRLVRQVEILDQVFETVPANRAAQLGPGFRAVLDGGE